MRLVLIAEIEPLDPASETKTARPVADVLDFGRLAPHVLRNRDVFVHCHTAASHSRDEVSWKRAAQVVHTDRAVGSVWATPGAGADFYVQLVDITPSDGIPDLVAALEDMYYGDLVLPDPGIPMRRVDGGRTHQIVIFSDPGDRELTEDEIQRLIYRADLDARPEYSDIVRPTELNRRVGRGAALGPFVSVLWGQQDYIENCAFLSAITGATASVVMFEARSDLMQEIAAIGNHHGDRLAADDTRDRLDGVNRTLASIENRIALCIDGVSTIMPYVPSLRVESFHRALFTALDTEFNRTALQRLLERLHALVDLEQEMLSSRVAQESDDRTLRWSLSIGLASLVAVPFTIVFGFFGANANEIDSARSIFSMQYWPIFAIVGGATLAIGMLHLMLYLHHKRESHRRRK
ncbi:hypothetical protein FB381_2971 [Nocardioides albertanoniae]|uniref:Uncharacterized protein n=1 Tax=Nocardioides albertanoniae TaxID=1175486 RepID=A0A543A997_9ACTN|nr:hypothetical protein [Nocardioides albertanoniae]TQL69070.1 hypothetical protein FB381_2971 [Nocardioides albertanoniae]